MSIAVTRVQNIDDILKVSEIIQRATDRGKDNKFIVPGEVSYDAKHFIASLQESLTNDHLSAAFYTDHAFIWGTLIIPVYNRRFRFAIENMFVSAWGKETVGHAARVLQVFEDWANINGASSIFVTIQDIADPRRGHYMRAKGYKPFETLYSKALPLDSAIGDVEEFGKIEQPERE